MNSVILYLKQVNPSVFDIIHLDESHQVISISENMTNTELVKLDKHNEITLVLSGAYLSLFTTPALEVKTHLRQQAIAYALEDEVIEPIEDLEFIILSNTNRGEYSVAVMSKVILQAITTELRAAQLNISRVAIDVLLLPLAESSWSVGPLGNQYAVRTGTHSGFVTDAANLAFIIQCTLAEASTKPIELITYSSRVVQELTTFSVTVTNKITPKPFQLMVNELPHSPNVVLPTLYQLCAKQKRTFKPWRIALALIVGWIGFTTAARAVEFLILNHRLNQLNNAVAVEYKKVFPQASSIVSPKFRFEQELKSLQTSNSLFFELLVPLTKVVQQYPEISIKKLQFSKKKLHVILHASKQDHIGGITEIFADEKIQVTPLTSSKENSNLIEFTLWKS